MNGIQGGGFITIHITPEVSRVQLVCLCCLAAVLLMGAVFPHSQSNTL